MLRLILFVCLISCTSSKDLLKGKVVKVYDGDTIELLTDDKKKIKIRLDGIDAPEKGQDYGEKSRQFLADMIAGKTISVKEIGKDQYGRLLGVIFINGKNVNEEMVRNGLAWHYRHFNNDERLADLEKKAKENKRNIWSVKNPIEPYQFRKSKKQKNSYKL